MGSPYVNKLSEVTATSPSMGSENNLQNSIKERSSVTMSTAKEVLSPTVARNPEVSLDQKETKILKAIGPI